MFSRRKQLKIYTKTKQQQQHVHRPFRESLNELNVFSNDREQKKKRKKGKPNGPEINVI